MYGADPFKRGASGRPWLVLSNHADRPFHGEQYIAVTLTTRSWLDGLIGIPASSWVRGGTPEPSRVVPWGVQSLAAGDIARWQGTLTESIVEKTIAALVEELDA
ncbi:type II toxin-antitoxin system PemK/MazF family toxin [Salarchaeum japonicum]|uniref:type II toxin-antitoxin system PemK/MazF family toxin n=1 Tax=Salarchaeum japonicum TaxID=555573 RepID=UPI001D0A60A2|nr:type II toxin-antitoxin system PemK/MazF family toxin [Salarchaeum japonicum]